MMKFTQSIQLLLDKSWYTLFIMGLGVNSLKGSAKRNNLFFSKCPEKKNLCWAMGENCFGETYEAKDGHMADLRV